MRLSHIIGLVARINGYTVAELLSTDRHQPLASYRQVAMYLCREFTDASYPTIGQAFGRDHSTVIHAHRKIAAMMARRPAVGPSRLRRAVDQMSMILSAQDELSAPTVTVSA